MNPWIVACTRAQADAMLPFATAENWLVEQAAPLVAGCRAELTGLYLATMDGGVQASIQFWADGLRDGLSFANPRDFHLTLANSPAAKLAIRYNLRGPNYTLVGGDEATLAALEHAQDDLATHLIEAAIVIRFDMMPVTSMIGLSLTTISISHDNSRK